MFTLSSAVLSQFRQQAELSMQQYLSAYDITITRDIYGNETISSGLLGTYKCYVGRAPSKSDTEEEIAQRLITAGVIKDKNALALLPYTVVIPSDAVIVVSGQAGEWNIAADNYHISPNHRFYTRLLLNRKDGYTEYRDRIGKNKM